MGGKNPNGIGKVVFEPVIDVLQNIWITRTGLLIGLGRGKNLFSFTDVSLYLQIPNFVTVLVPKSSGIFHLFVMLMSCALHSLLQVRVFLSDTLSLKYLLPGHLPVLHHILTLREIHSLP